MKNGFSNVSRIVFSPLTFFHRHVLCTIHNVNCVSCTRHRLQPPTLTPPAHKRQLLTWSTPSYVSSVTLGKCIRRYRRNLYLQKQTSLSQANAWLGASWFNNHFLPVRSQRVNSYRRPETAYRRVWRLLNEKVVWPWSKSRKKYERTITVQKTSLKVSFPFIVSLNFHPSTALILAPSGYTVRIHTNYTSLYCDTITASLLHTATRQCSCYIRHQYFHVIFMYPCSAPGNTTSPSSPQVY